MMDIIGKLTSSRCMPDGRTLSVMNVIYQCNEDGLADTIKPRLEKAKANCEHIGYIKEETIGLTLDDELIRNIIIEMNARLLVVDPFQAYVGDADLSNAISMRRILRRLSVWANATNCAVVLIGHLNKKIGSNELYRSLGSIDLIAAARSVIQVENDLNNPGIKLVKHIKSSLASKGSAVGFTIDDDGEVTWLGNRDSNLTTNNDECEAAEYYKTKQELVAKKMVDYLKNGPIEASAIHKMLIDAGYSERTISIAKKIVAINSVKIKNKWYWVSSNHGDRNDDEV